jgi:hypothetical protein
MAALKQTLKLHSNGNFSAYLKRFSSIEKSLLLEIVDGKFIAKTHTPDKAVVKVSSTDLTEIFDSVDNTKPVKIGMFAVDNFVQTFKHLGESDVKFEIDSEEVNKEQVATGIKIYNKNLKFNFPCSSPSMFKYIGTDLMKKIVDTSGSVFSFRIDKDTLGKISSLCSIDADNDTLTIYSNAGSVYIAGKSFEQELPGITVDAKSSISFYKVHYAFIDKEDSEIFVLEDKVIFKSLESETAIVIGRVH